MLLFHPFSYFQSFIFPSSLFPSLSLLPFTDPSLLHPFIPCPLVLLSVLFSFPPSYLALPHFSSLSSFLPRLNPPHLPPFLLSNHPPSSSCSSSLLVFHTPLPAIQFQVGRRVKPKTSYGLLRRSSVPLVPSFLFLSSSTSRLFCWLAISRGPEGRVHMRGKKGMLWVDQPECPSSYLSGSVLGFEWMTEGWLGWFRFPLVLLLSFTYSPSCSLSFCLFPSTTIRKVLERRK